MTKENIQKQIDETDKQIDDLNILMRRFFNLASMAIAAGFVIELIKLFVK